MLLHVPIHQAARRIKSGTCRSTVPPRKAHSSRASEPLLATRRFEVEDFKKAEREGARGAGRGGQRARASWVKRRGASQKRRYNFAVAGVKRWALVIGKEQVRQDGRRVILVATVRRID